MSVTPIGIKYATMIHEGEAVWPDDIPKRRRQDTYDSYLEMKYEPPIEPPTD